MQKRQDLFQKNDLRPSLRCFLILLFLLLSKNIWARPETPSLSTPRKSMTVFLKSMKAVKEGEEQAIERAITTFDLDHEEFKGRINYAHTQAINLINVLDRLEYIDVKKIPNHHTLPLWVFKRQSIHLDGEFVDVEIALKKAPDGQYLFSKKTLLTVDKFARYLKTKKIVEGVIPLRDWKSGLKEKMPEWTSKKIFSLLSGQWLALFLLILVAFIIDFFILKYLFHKSKKLVAKKSPGLSKKLYELSEVRLGRPLSLVVISGIWNIGILFFELPLETLQILSRVGKIFFTFGLIWSLHRAVDLVADFFEKKALASENKFDDILVPLLRKTAKVFIICIGTVLIGQSLTLNVTNLVAGLGIGGLAFALAAKDTLSNLFGSVTVIFDRPFHIGDWVVIGEKIEGNVESVGLRSTKIRTFYDSLISVPNNLLTNVQIDNFGARKYRRYSTTLNLPFETPPEKVEVFCEGIRQLILGHEHTRKDYFHVYLNGENQYGLGIMLYVFWQCKDWSQELNERHRLMLAILQLAKKLHIPLTWPGQNIFLRKEGELASPELPQGLPWPPDELHQKAQALAQECLKEPLVSPNHRSGKKLHT